MTAPCRAVFCGGKGPCCTTLLPLCHGPRRGAPRAWRGRARSAAHRLSSRQGASPAGRDGLKNTGAVCLPIRAAGRDEPDRERIVGVAGTPHKDLHAKLASPAVLSGMPRTRGALHAKEPLPYRTEEALGHHGTQGWAPALDRWRLSYSTTFGVPETGRVPVRMKVSTRPKTRSLPQKCPRAMAARNSGRRSSKRRSRAGSRVIMSACMP